MPLLVVEMALPCRQALTRTATPLAASPGHPYAYANRLTQPIRVGRQRSPRRCWNGWGSRSTRPPGSVRAWCPSKQPRSDAGGRSRSRGSVRPHRDRVRLPPGRDLGGTRSTKGSASPRASQGRRGRARLKRGMSTATTCGSATTVTSAWPHWSNSSGTQQEVGVMFVGAALSPGGQVPAGDHRPQRPETPVPITQD